MKKLFLLICILYPYLVVAQQLKVDKLLCDYKTDPLGIESPAPGLSWILASDTTLNNIMQTAFRIQVAEKISDFENHEKLIWDSKKHKSSTSVNVEYEGPNLKPEQTYYWRVKVWDNHNRESRWSKVAKWETGLTDKSLWHAKWITPNIPEKDKVENPIPLLRKDFTIGEKIKKARLYITSHGLYKATINGQPVTDHLFTPGWTSYNKRLQYQVYDVTGLLKKGRNATGVTLGDGWFRGTFGWQNNWYLYGKKLALLFQLEIELQNGEKIYVISDDTWKSETGPIRAASVYNGIYYNANYEITNWDTAGFDDSNWHNVNIENFSFDNIVPTSGEPVRRIEELKAKKKIITPKKEIVFDFGQNITGWVRFNLKGKKGDSITILHAEVLDNKGNFYTKNLRKAKQQVRYVFKDNNPVVFEPEFTYQGFRYIQIKDFTGEVNIDNFTAISIHSDLEPAGHFECSDSLVNKLHQNIRWSMRDNFLDVPTDCPQRDERLGWTGDAQVFCSTSNYLYNTASFYNKWLKDLNADQLPNGSIPFVVPKVFDGNGSTGWGDVATVLPYQLYLSYGDIRILENNFDMMKGWVDYLVTLTNEKGIVDKGTHFGDWLFYINPTNWNDKPGYTDHDLISTAFLAHSASIVANVARILNKQEDEKKYNQLFDTTKRAFVNEFMTPTGRLSPNTQTAYVLALAFNLIPDDKKKGATQYLVENIKKRGYHLSTGFLGTPHLCHVLSENDANNLAYKLLLQDTYPSWIYPITKGATTIWERWDGIKPDGTFQTDEMNSFNHYAYGAIGNWLYSKVAGICPDINQPGYRHIIMKPMPDASLNYAKAEYKTLYGTVSSFWKIEGNTFTMTVDIPVNSSATVYFPFSGEIKEIGSGHYNYTYTIE